MVIVPLHLRQLAILELIAGMSIAAAVSLLLPASLESGVVPIGGYTLTGYSTMRPY